MSEASAEFEPFIGLLLCQATNHWQRRLRGALRQHALTQAQFVLLEAAARTTSEAVPATQVALAKASRLDITVVSQVARQLAARGLLARRRGPDERSRELAITPAGTELVRQALPALRRLDGEFFALLGSNHDAFAQALAALAGDRVRVRVRAR